MPDGDEEVSVCEAELVILLDVVAELTAGGGEESIYAARPWTAVSLAMIAEDESQDVPVGLAYMLEVDLAIEAIDVWERWHGRPATAKDRCRAVVHYATYDSFLEE